MCSYCETVEPLNSVADTWLFDEPVTLEDQDYLFGAVINVEKKNLEINVSSVPIGYVTHTKKLDINFCPMCGKAIK